MLTSISPQPGGSTPRTCLGLDRPLSYTHLGEVVAGANGMDVDMRAEVAVLSRNVVLQVGGC